LRVAGEEYRGAWTIKVIGDPQVYKEEFKEGSFTNGVIMVKSLVWPGAYIFYKNDRWFTFYIGYGYKADKKDYYPVMPQIPLEVPLEPPEEPEPNPKESANDSKLNDPEVIKSLIAILEEVLANAEKFEDVLTRTFEEVDEDHSGEIKRNEADRLLREFSKQLEIPLEPGTKAVEEFFKLFDKDKSGTISKEELADPLRGLLGVWIDVLKERLEEFPQEAESP
jgi:Ca2+-binding EF-hand superfamily protein